jgi:predicted metal-dependent phosphoesterase TrpH
VHSTASDGELPPEAVVERAAAAGLAAIALTDHDTVAGVPAAFDAGRRLGLRVVGGCEFSVAAPWGEMHVLGYFLPSDSAELEMFLVRCRTDRERRGRAMVDRLHRIGVDVTEADVLAEADGGAIGRPHVARALVRRGYVASVGDAFDRYLGRGRPGFVDKALPTFKAVADLVHQVGGVVSAAHLKDRGTRAVLLQLQADGLDAIETRHPSHDPEIRARLTDLALSLKLLRSGGSDWHGDPEGDETHGALGSQEVPLEWLERLEAARPVGSTSHPSA